MSALNSVNAWIYEYHENNFKKKDFLLALLCIMWYNIGMNRNFTLLRNRKMRCKKCECWRQGMPSNFPISQYTDEIVTTKDYGFCELHDDVMFADEGCNATSEQKAKRVKLPKGD